MSKDMDLVMDAAKASGADLPAASVAQSVLATNVPASGDLDLAAITPFVVGQGTKVAATSMFKALSDVKRSCVHRELS